MTSELITNARQLADADGQFIPVNGINTYYIEKGPRTGKVILLLHGFGGSTVIWRFVMKPLADAGFRVIAFDRPPFGLTDKPTHIDYSHPAQADFVAYFMDALKIQRATIVGHSMGANVLAYFALQYPEMLHKLVIVDGTIVKIGGPPALLAPLVGIKPIANGIRWLLRKMITPERYAKFIVSTHATPVILSETDLAAYMRPMRLAGWDTALVALIRYSAKNQIPLRALSAIGAPTLIMWGEKDRIIPVQQGRVLCEYLTNHHWVIYKNVGHSPMEETPAQFCNDVLRFLEHAV